MIRESILALGSALGIAAWLFTRRDALPSFKLPDLAGVFSFGGGGDSESGRFIKVDGVDSLYDVLGSRFDTPAQANMRRLVPHLDSFRYDANVKAFLHVIRAKEHLPHIAHTDAAYRVIVGGKTFTSFAAHPRIFGVPNSTAAGAYQITATTWDDVRRETGSLLNDFSPVNQEKAACLRIAYRGAARDVLAGRFERAIAKCRAEWTSVPGASQSQPGYTIADASRIFKNYGGTIA